MKLVCSEKLYSKKIVPAWPPACMVMAANRPCAIGGEGFSVCV